MDDEKPFKFDIGKELAEIKNNPKAVISVVVLLAVCCLVMPFSIFLLPPVLVVLGVLLWLSFGNATQAKKLARAHIDGKKSEFEIEEGVGTTGTLVLNDWGITFVKTGQPPIEVKWDDIQSVDELGIGVLKFSPRSGAKSDELEVDLSLNRYTMVTEAIDSKMPGRANFDVDPKTGKSNVLSRLRTEPRRWTAKGKNLVVSDSGIEFGTNEVNWSDVTSVREGCTEIEDDQDVYALIFTSSRGSFEITNRMVSLDKEIPRYTGYDLLKLIVCEKLPDKTQFQSRVFTPQMRAKDEFERCHETAKVALKMAISKNNYKFAEAHFLYLLKLVNKYDLHGRSVVQDFYQDYAQLLQNTGREEEAEQMRKSAI